MIDQTKPMVKSVSALGGVGAIATGITLLLGAINAPIDAGCTAQVANAVEPAIMSIVAGAVTLYGTWRRKDISGVVR